jgi:YihY family inner membrane protein
VSAIDRTIDRLDAFQRRRRTLGFVLAVQKRYGEDRGGWLGAVASYYALFALLPLLLVLVTAVSWIFRNHPSVRDDVLDAVWSQLPFVGPDVRKRIKPVSGNPLVVTVSLLISLWGALGVVRVTQDLSNTIWGVPRYRYPGFLPKLARALAVFALLLVGVLSTAAVAGLTIGPHLPWAGRVLVTAMSVALNTVLAIMLFRILTARPLGWREILPGALVLGVGAYALTVLGGIYVQHVIAKASSLYGSFAGMIGLLAWISLLVQLLVIATLVNAVRVRELWPRSITGRNLGPGDERAVQLTMQREELLAKERFSGVAPAS